MTTLNLGRAVLYGVDGNPVGAFAAGAGATDTVIPLALVNDPATGVTLSANMQVMLIGSYVQFLTGQNKGAFAQITGAAPDSITVEVLANAPDQGDILIIHRVGQNVAGWGGTAVTGRDVTGDVQMLQNLDLSVTSLRDALRGTGSKTISDLDTLLAAIKNTDGIKKVVDTVNVALTGSLTTITHSTFAVTTASQQALAANTNRKYLLLINDSDTVIYIKIGGAAAVNQGIRLNPNGGSYEMSSGLGNLHTGAIYAIHGGSGNKNLLIAEGV